MTPELFRKYLQDMDRRSGHEVAMFDCDVKQLGDGLFFYCFDATVGCQVKFNDDGTVHEVQDIAENQAWPTTETHVQKFDHAVAWMDFAVKQMLEWDR